MPSTSINNRSRKASPLKVKILELGREVRNSYLAVERALAERAGVSRNYRAVTDEANDLIRKGDPHLAAMGELGKRVLSRLSRCTPGSQCNVIGCPKCSRLRLIARTEQLCEKALAFRTADPQTMLITIGVGSRYWTGEIEGCKDTLNEDMKVFEHKVIRRIKLIKGYSLNFDANPSEDDEQLGQGGRENTITRAEGAWHLHLHGTLAVKGTGKERLETVWFQLRELCNLHNLDVKIELEEVWNNRPKAELKGLEVLQKENAARFNIHSLSNWCMYAGKIVGGYQSKAGEKFRNDAELTRVLQRHLMGQQLEWSGGVLSRKDSPLKPIHDARGAGKWISDLQTLFLDFVTNPEGLDMSEIDDGIIRRNLIDLAKGLSLSQELVKQTTAQRRTVLCQRRRRKRRIDKLQSKYTGELFRQEVAKIHRRHRQERARQEEARRMRQDTIDMLWTDLSSCIERVFKRTTRIIAGLNPKEISRRVIVAELAGSDNLQMIAYELTAAGHVYAVRRKIRELTQGADYLARQGVQDGTDDRALSRAYEMLVSLEHWNSHWPCRLEGENIRELDWNRWWELWLDRHFTRICAT